MIHFRLVPKHLVVFTILNKIQDALLTLEMDSLYGLVCRKSVKGLCEVINSTDNIKEIIRGFSIHFAFMIRKCLVAPETVIWVDKQIPSNQDEDV